MIRRTIPVVILVVATQVFADPPPGPPQTNVRQASDARVDTLDLLLLGDKPTRLELRVDVAGTAVPRLWDETFAALFAFHDCDDNGMLDRTEAARAPPAFALRQIVWGQFALATGAPPFVDLDADASGAVEASELTGFYRRAGLGGVLVAIGKPPATGILTDAILQRVDADADELVTEPEWLAASSSLLRFDANDDELIAPGELIGTPAYPGAFGSMLLLTPDQARGPDPVADSFPLVLLSPKAADSHLVALVSKWIPSGSVETLRAVLAASPETTWHMRFGQRGDSGASLEVLGKEPPVAGQLACVAPGIRLDLRADDDGKLPDQMKIARQRLLAAFVECDINADSCLDASELDAARSAQLRAAARIADRNANDGVTQSELETWLDLQDRIAGSHVLLTVIDRGTGLFEVLDANRDGGLSVRELRTAWPRLQAVGCTPAGRFDQKRLPRQLLATISRGHPRTPLGTPVRQGPEWFRAMNRNGDEDVSQREFTGPASVFAKLDTDHDGLLDGHEAQAQLDPRP